jgi:6-phosphogluconolactonase (cycloisomerase 2 family)
LEGAKFAAAEVLLPPPNDVFPSTLVYASNRNSGPNNDPRGDSIAVFTLDADGKLQIINQIFTGLSQVRGMEFGGPDNTFLVTSGAAGDGGVVVFERVGQGAGFVQVASNKDILELKTLAWA